MQYEPRREALTLPGAISNYLMKENVKDEAKWMGQMLPSGEIGKKYSKPRQQHVWKYGE